MSYKAVSQVNATATHIENIVLYTNDGHEQGGLSSGRGWDKVGKFSVIEFFVNKGVATNMLASFQTVNYWQNSTFSANKTNTKTDANQYGLQCL